VPGLVNLDFADVKTIMSGMGMAIMGTGIAEGEDRAIKAATMAISSPLLEDASVNGARGVIINVTGGTDFSLVEVSEASSIIQQAAHEDANIIFGAVVDPAMEGRIKITVIATGFDDKGRRSGNSSGTTPVDLHSFVAHREGAVLERHASSKVAIGRRPAIELPMLPMALAAGGDVAGDVESSPFDVPAFLRRQSEG
jgi:cell division protein FtsZ